MPSEALRLVLPRQQNQSRAVHDGMAKSPEPPAVLYFKATYAGGGNATTGTSWPISAAISLTNHCRSAWGMGAPVSAALQRKVKPRLAQTTAVFCRRTP